MPAILGFLALALLSFVTFPASQAGENPLAGEPRGWTAWSSLGGSLTSDPAACSYKGRDTIVFARGDDRHVWFRERNYSTGTWGEWTRVPGDGTITASPAVTCGSYADGNARVDLFVTSGGPLYHLWHLARNNTAWSFWEYVAGDVAPNSGVGVADLGTGTHELFARGTNNQLLQRSFDGKTWSRWTETGTFAFKYDPAAVSWGPNHLQVFAVGADDRLWHRQLKPVVNPWSRLEGSVTSSPRVISRASGTMDAFIRGEDTSLWHRTFANGTWSPRWESLGGSLLGGPGAAVYVDVRMMIFARGGDRKIWYRAWAPTAGQPEVRP